MHARLRSLRSTAFLFFLGLGGTALSQCQNPNLFPGIATIPDPAGGETLVSSCTFFSEYSWFSGIEAGSTYRFNISDEGYITLREGTATGPVVASGYSYLIYEAPNAQDLYAHYTANENCDQNSICHTNSVQKLVGCIPPQAWYSFSGDCNSGEFYIDLDISSVGSSTSLTVETDVFGSITTYTGVQPGILQVGPFYVDEVVNVTLIHGGDPSCDIVFTDLVPAAGCPVQVQCGAPPISMNYCYDNTEILELHFQGIGTGSIRIDFLAGTMDPSWSETFVIHDGADASAPIIFQHTGTTNLDLTGMTFFSSGPDLFINFMADGWNSCADGIHTEWSWQVACLQCALPQASVDVTEDCDNNQFNVVVDVASTGDGSTIDLNYTVNGTPQTLAGVGTGISTLGPFAINDQISLSMAHEFDALCNINLGNFTDSGMCPTLVTCGEPDVLESYCYTDSDDQFWVYELVGTDGALYLQFTAGFIESSSFDHLTIYDGPDANSPILFDHTDFNMVDLAGLAVTSTSGSLFMTMSSDGSVSCAGGNPWQWEWFLTCLDCQPPQATFSMQQDCDNFEYYVNVDFASLGSDPEIEITNSVNATIVTASSTGSTLVGPFTSGQPVQLTLVNDANNLCNVVSPTFVNPICPTPVCGTNPLLETYCYTSPDTMEWAYSVSTPGTVRLVFNQGTIESNTWDKITIYDGQDANAPVLFDHTTFQTMQLGPGPVGTHYSVDLTTTGQFLYMRLTTDWSVDCQSGFDFEPWEWEVSCVGCQAPGIAYEFLPDCEHLSYGASVNISSLNGPMGYTITENTGNTTVNATAVGEYPFETFMVDSAISFTVVDLDQNCTYETTMTYTREDCIIESCGVDNYTLCYENDDDRWYTYSSLGGGPISIYFTAGQLMPGDFIVLYNSPIDTAIYYQGDNSGNVTGVYLNSDNPSNALTLRVKSNGAGSCQDGGAEVPLTWSVGCGAIGMDELGITDLQIFPNPANDRLQIVLMSAQMAGGEIRVMDMSGRTVIQDRVIGMNHLLNVAALQNGQYVLQMTNDDHVITRNFQVMR
jgi:hypothetical protein